jgi:hypothetical protein
MFTETHFYRLSIIFTWLIPNWITKFLQIGGQLESPWTESFQFERNPLQFLCESDTTNEPCAEQTRLTRPTYHQPTAPRHRPLTSRLGSPVPVSRLSLPAPAVRPLPCSHRPNQSSSNSSSSGKLAAPKQRRGKEDLRKGEGIRSGKHELDLRRLSLSSSNREIRKIPTIEDDLAAAGGQIRPPRRGGRQQQRLQGAGAAAVQGVGDHHLRPHRRHHRHFRGRYLFGS